MKIHEYQARDLFGAAGIPVPPAKVARTPAEARAMATEFAAPVVVKAQVLSGGRGKAGGVKLAANPDEAEAAAEQILGLDIRGYKVEKVLVAVASDIATEIYLGAIVDRQTQSVLLMASAEGGVEIEETARTNPEAILKAPADPSTGLASHQARAVGFGLGLDWPQVRQFDALARKLVQVVVNLDASLAEINPLIVTPEGELRAIDAKVNIDDSAVFRHPDLAELRNPEEETGPVIGRPSPGCQALLYLP